MKTGANAYQVRTTIGDLIVAIVDAALEVSENEERAYHLTGLILNSNSAVEMSEG